jgi:hypothetical protein
MELYKPKQIEIPGIKLHEWEPRKTIGMIYGHAGTGKTNILEQIANAGLRVFVIDCDTGGVIGKKLASLRADSYKKACDIVYSIKPNEFDVISLDSVDLLREFANEETCTDLNVSYLGNTDWGGGWDYEKNLIKRLTIQLARLNAHIIYVAHSTITDKKLSSEKTVKVVEPNLRKKIFNIVGDNAVYALYIKMVGTKRVVMTEPTDTVFAKDRTCLFENAIVLEKDSTKLSSVYKEAFKRNG